MYYIRSASSITNQHTFNNPGFSGSLKPLEKGSALLVPDFKTYINPALIRRMSEILRMGVACSKNALELSGVVAPDAIITGTGLGCLLDTEKFLNNALTIEGGMLPPTSFIQSTHNTIAGQISLLLENRSYNMTHTQNTLSFERSLEDAFLCLDEGLDHVLVGGADEVIPQLALIFEQLGLQQLHLATGASFFILSKQKADAKVALTDAAGYGHSGGVEAHISALLSQHNMEASAIDLVLYASMDDGLAKDLSMLLAGATRVDYQKFCGVYATNAAFALHMAADLIANQTMKLASGREIKNVLIVNRLYPANTGLQLVQSV